MILRTIPRNSVDLTITSPPYFQLKDYGHIDQIGWAQSKAAYLKAMKEVLTLLLDVTCPTGSCFVVIGDTYKNKCLQLIPHELSLAARDAGWCVRNDIIWNKLDAPPDRATDRWRNTHEHILFLTKHPKNYVFNIDSIRVPYSDATVRRWGKGQKYGGAKATTAADSKGQRFRRGKSFCLNPLGTVPSDVIDLPTSRSKEFHYATFPPKLIERLILATTKAGDQVLDPFAGTGTTGIVAIQHQRRFTGIEIVDRFAEIAERLCCSATTTQSTSSNVC